MASTVPTPLRVPKTAEVLASHIRRQIIRGDLAEGDFLPGEADLMGQFKISRPTLREAFRILESERLIEVRRGARGGARVLGPDPAVAARHLGLLLQVRGTTLADVQAAREFIEPAAVRRIATSPGLKKAIRELQAANDEARAAAEDVHWSAGKIFGFHLRLVELAGNNTVSTFMNMIGEIVEMQLAAVYSSRAEREPEEVVRDNMRAIKANQRMIELLKAGDPDGAESYWREHVAAVARHISQGTPVEAVTVLDLLG